MTGKRETHRRLHELEVPENPEAKARAIALAQREIQRRDLDPVERPWREARVARVVLVAIVFGMFLLTDPGRGLAERVGDLVGIGDEPTEAPVFTNPGRSAEQVVIGVGGGRGDVPRYEVIASRTEETDGEAPLCFRASFPELDQRGALQCLTDAALGNLSPETTRPAAFVLEGMDQIAVVGIVGPGVHEVLVGPTQAPAEIHRLSPGLLSPGPAGSGLSYFVAFNEAGPPSPSPIRVSSFDSNSRRLFTSLTEVSARP